MANEVSFVERVSRAWLAEVVRAFVPARLRAAWIGAAKQPTELRIANEFVAEK